MGINYLAAAVAALSGFVVGAVWYGPLFGRQWAVASSVQGEPRFAFSGVYAFTLVMNFVAAVVLAYLAHLFDARGVTAGAKLGLLLWLGFIMTVRVSEALFNRTNLHLVLIDAGYRLVWLLVMGIIVGAWH